MREFKFIKDKFISLNIPYNTHFLDRYIKFVLDCDEIIDKNIYGESHHILPKGNSMFPEYESNKVAPWNIKRIDARAHYLCHWMLMKAFPTDFGQVLAFDSMCNGSNTIHGRNYTVNSKAFKAAKIEKSRIMSLIQTGRVGPGRGKFGKDALAFGCKWSDESKKRQSDLYRGKTYEDILGIESAKIKRSKISAAVSGKLNPSFGYVYCYDLLDINSTVKLTKEEYDNQIINKSLRYMIKGRASCNKIKLREGIIKIRMLGKIVAEVDASTLLVTYRIES